MQTKIPCVNLRGLNFDLSVFFYEEHTMPPRQELFKPTAIEVPSDVAPNLYDFPEDKTNNRGRMQVPK